MIPRKVTSLKGWSKCAAIEATLTMLGVSRNNCSSCRMIANRTSPLGILALLGLRVHIAIGGKGLRHPRDVDDGGQHGDGVTLMVSEFGSHDRRQQVVLHLDRELS